ncbi:MAG TPA: lipid A deacylase LpxR family protein [Alphaproteobacteria bacterium]|nr:lipid A deacylase LpxR family protein [Alphaproteobacteria bacterium]
MQKNPFITAQRASLIILALMLLAGPARADEGRVTITEENDSLLSRDDRHYTQGVRLSYLSGQVEKGGTWNQPFQQLSQWLPIFQNDGPATRKYDWTVLGQSIFTPSNTLLTTPSPSDRPYAGWLYTGVGLLQETALPGHHRLENLELLVGVVGPASLAAETQTDWHQFFNGKPARGWSHQLSNEPGLVLSYERKWRFQQPLGNGLALDAIPEAGASGGNVFTYGQAGALFRFGKNLAADYGPTHIRPSLSGTGWFDKSQMEGDWGWYFFTGAQGRAVARNIFLDGNSFASSPSVNKKPFVGDFVAGFSVFWSDAAKLDLTFTQRSKEFYGQTGHADHFGGVNVSVRF